MRRMLSPTGVTFTALVLGLAAAVAVQVTAPAPSAGSLPHGVRLHSYEFRGAPAGARQLVRFREIAGAGRRTPGEALLLWWQKVQLGESGEDIARSYAPQARVTPRRLDRQLQRIRYLFSARKPRLVEAREDGRHATVIAVLDAGSLAVDPVAQQPHRFEAVRHGGVWRLRDNRFMEERYAAEMAYIREQGVERR